VIELSCGTLYSIYIKKETIVELGNITIAWILASKEVYVMRNCACFMKLLLQEIKPSRCEFTTAVAWINMSYMH
jgi:hypothetical protein